MAVGGILDAMMRESGFRGPESRRCRGVVCLDGMELLFGGCGWSGPRSGQLQGELDCWVMG